MITITFLADHLDAISTLINWFREQWPAFYANWSQSDFEQDFLEDAHRQHLPIRLLAFESGQLVGTMVLREHRGETPWEVQPEFGGLYVVESHRGHGIGTALIQAGMNLARNQGYATAYATTVMAAGILERLGWEFIKTEVHQDEQLSLYRCKL
jgi:GNAT superfamily N-acetyltransferase